MKNTKTIKTVLFASLIAAMILPFYAMEMVSATSNENTNDKGQINSAKKYKVGVLSKIITDEGYVDGVKVVKYKNTIKLLEKPTVKDLMDDNKEYLDFLRTQGEEGNKLAAEEISKYHEVINNLNDEMEIETAKVGDHSISFGTVTYDSPNGNSKDPINLLFHNQGYAYNAKYRIDNNALHSWHSATGGSQYVFIDNTAHPGGSSYWQLNSYQLEEGSYTDRYHVRIFEGGYDTHQQFNYWSLGAGHRENCTPSCHTHYTNSWEVTESEIKNDLTGQTGVGTVSSIYLGNGGYYQGIYNNGYAGYIQLN